MTQLHPGLDIKAHTYPYVARDLTFVKASGFVHPQAKTRYSLILLSRERQL